MVIALVICYDYLPQVHSLAIVTNEKKEKVQRNSQKGCPNVKCAGCIKKMHLVRSHTAAQSSKKLLICHVQSATIGSGEA